MAYCAAQATVPSMAKHGQGAPEGLRAAQRKLPPLRIPTTSGAPPARAAGQQGGGCSVGARRPHCSLEAGVKHKLPALVMPSHISCALRCGRFDRVSKSGYTPQ